MRRSATAHGRFIAALAHQELVAGLGDQWICAADSAEIKRAVRGARKVWQAAEQDAARWMSRAAPPKGGTA